jgi:hypothetical protein
MKKFLIVIVMVVVALGLTTAFYAKPVEVKGIIQKALWNRAGSGFELTSQRTTLLVPAEKDVWNRTGSGFELSSMGTAFLTSVQKEAWNRFGSDFELSSVRTPAEIKASIQKYMWNQAGSGFELTSVRTALTASDQK